MCAYSWELEFGDGEESWWCVFSFCILHMHYCWGKVPGGHVSFQKINLSLNWWYTRPVIWFYRIPLTYDVYDLLFSNLAIPCQLIAQAKIQETSCYLVNCESISRMSSQFQQFLDMHNYNNCPLNAYCKKCILYEWCMLHGSVIIIRTS